MVFLNKFALKHKLNKPDRSQFQASGSATLAYHSLLSNLQVPLFHLQTLNSALTVMLCLRYPH